MLVASIIIAVAVGVYAAMAIRDLRRPTDRVQGARAREARKPASQQQPAAVKSRSRAWLAIKIIALPIIICQALALVSFIHEEAIQAAGFAAYGAIRSKDAPIAWDCVKRFERVMLQAQSFQDGLGRLAWWAHPAYESYFFKSAPAQLCSFYAQGVQAELWEADASRWVMREVNGCPVFVDTWKCDAVGRLRAQGFKPELIWPEMNAPPGEDEQPREVPTSEPKAEKVSAEKAPSWPPVGKVDLLPDPVPVPPKQPTKRKHYEGEYYWRHEL